jgi:hypothetical protein
MEDTSNEPSLKKTLISFSEYQRLKDIETKYLEILHQKEQDLKIIPGKFLTRNKKYKL